MQSAVIIPKNKIPRSSLLYFAVSTNEHKICVMQMPTVAVCLHEQSCFYCFAVTDVLVYIAIYCSLWPDVVKYCLHMSAFVRFCVLVLELN